MSHFTPKEKTRKLEQVLSQLKARSQDTNWTLLDSFSRVVYAALPDWMARNIAAPELADRLIDNYRFFVEELPPQNQLYRGVPGLHVVARSSDENEVLHTVRGKGMPMDTTIVETHTPDAPFVFDALKNYFRKAGLRVFSAIHPIITVRRQWERIVWIGDAQAEGDKELLCRFRIEPIESKERLRRLQHEIFCVLKCVFLALEDFQEMMHSVDSVAGRLHTRRGGGPNANLEPARDFLNWLLEENFILMGMASYRIGPDAAPHRIPEGVLGVFRDPTLLPVVFPGLVEEVERRLLPMQQDERIIDIDYCSNASAIYHLEPIDYLVVRHWDQNGQLETCTLILGRFSQGAFAQRATDVPILRQRQAQLMERSGAMPMSNAFRQIRALFNRLPRRELFYAPVEDLQQFLNHILQITGDDEIAVHHRVGAGYVALYLAFSKLRYSHELEQNLQRTLSQRYGAITFATSRDTESAQVVFLYFDVNRMDRALDEDEILKITERLLTTWPEAVSRQLNEAFGEKEGRKLFQRWVTPETRSGLYREATAPHEVPFDVEHLDALEGRLEVAVAARSPEHATLKLYALKPLGFIEILTTLGHLGLKVTGELHIPLQLPGRQTAHLYRYEIEDDTEGIQALVEGIDRIRDALRALEEERASDDRLNALVLRAALNWRQVEVLRTCRNHLQQIRPHYNVETVNGVLLRNADVARALFHAFEARFDPQIEGGRSKVTERVEAEVQTALDAVRSLVEDEVLRALANLISATVRTNFYQSPERPVVSIKVDSHKVEGMPSPKPMCEIYVHSRRLQGIHLRGGRIARGGIRWSDRHDDFRTEVLGLMKTQTVKNSIIVPLGSKGGFVLKGSLPPRPGLDGYLIERYREFISGLLDVTDNVVDDKVCYPPEVVRHDNQDPYLVVAADKGTAHLSDTANAVAKHYGFWLGDAFASGGSVGYDHKKVAITARGAWECVKHHFANLGIDVNEDSFTAAGIGDMAGDVFGNGMLLSRTIKLVAAFNHLHILIDPDPLPDRSHRERERLFRLPRSSWRDYDPSVISPGGGVFDRSDKSIPVSPEMKSLFGISQDHMSGEQMIRNILKLPVDLLYNGGIGTYVKASNEDNISVGDRTNDRVRVDGGDIRARVIGEGGNLGLTQKARLEYWAKGGLINTDAVDNSGGVDMSDHEVNIKILMDMLVKKGIIPNRAERDRTFLGMTEDVAKLVLLDNARQALALTLDGIRSAARYEDFAALTEELVATGILNRQDAAVPRRKQLLDSVQRHRGLPRPLLAMVLGHVKIWAYEQIVETDFADSPEGTPFLESYFPAPLREAFAEHFAAHPLRREIITTVAVNHLVDRAGVDFLSRMTKQTGAGIGDVLKAYMNVSIQSKAHETRQGILAATMEAASTHVALLQLEDILEQATTAALEGQNPAPVVQELQKKLNL